MADDVFATMLDGVADGSVKLDTPAKPDPIFDAIADEAKAQEDQANAAAAHRSMSAMPDQYADHLQLAKTFGVPVDFAGRNAEPLKAFKGFTDTKRMMDNNPPLAKWYTTGDNPAAIKYDELRHLDGLSWLGAAVGQSFMDSYRDVSFNELQYRKAMKTATGDEIARLNDMEAAQEPRTYAADSWIEQGFVGAAAQLPVIGSMLVGGAKRGVQAADVAGVATLIAGQLGPQVAAPEELITVPTAMAGGYAVGSVYGAFETDARQQTGAAYYEFANMRDETGKVMDPDVARVAAIIAGNASSVLDTLSFEKMGSVVPGFNQVKNMLTKDAVKAALLRPTVRQALSTFAKHVAETGATETATETVQEAIQIFAGEAAKEYSNEAQGGQFNMTTGADIAARLGDTFEQTLQTMTVLGPALSGTRLGADIRRVRQTAQQTQIIQALNDHAAGNELNARLPEKAKEAVRAITADGPIQHVYVAPEAFSQFFQNADDAKQFFQTVGLTEEFAESQRTGRDMEVPIESYYVNLAGTEIGNAIKDHVKLSPDAFSQKQADDFNGMWKAAQERLAEEHAAGLEVDQAARLGEEKVFDDVKDKAMNAGIVPDQAAQYAKLYSQFFRTMAARGGVDAHDLYQQYGFDVKRALPTETELKAVDNLDLALEVIRRGRIDPLRKQVEKAAGPSLLEAIIARGGIVDQGGELAAMNLPAKAIRKGTAGGQTDLVGKQDNQFGADDVARQMWEEGYFPDLEERPTPDDLFNALREELGGNKRRSPMYDQTGEARIQQSEGLVKFADMLDQLGLDPKTMTNDEIRKAVDEAVNADPNAAALFQVPVDVAKTLNTPVDLPTDETFVQAVANTPGAEITEDGLVLDLTRYQPEEQSGGQAIRTGVFYLPTGSANEKHYKSGKTGYGGKVKVQGETLIRNPLFVKGSTGGKAPEAAYDAIKGKGAYQKMRSAVLAEINKGWGKKPTEEDVSNVLEAHGASGNAAWEILRVSKTGNTLPYAIQENIVAHAIREAGHDAMIGWSKGKEGPFIAEVFDVREDMVPTPEGDFQVHDEFYQADQQFATLAEEKALAKQMLDDLRATKDAGGQADKEATTAAFNQMRKAGAARDDLAAELAKTDNGVELVNSKGDMHAAVTKSQSVEGGWRVTHFNASGFLGHTEHKTKLSAVKEALQEGFDKEDAGALARAVAAKTFFQRAEEAGQSGGTKRGSIQLAPGRTIINMFDQADLSTFLHESGHFFLEVFRDLAAKQQGAVRAPDPAAGKIRFYHGTDYATAEGFTGKTFVSAQEEYARNYGGGSKNVLYVDMSKDEAIKAGLYDEINDRPMNGSIEGADGRMKPLMSSQIQDDWAAIREYLGITNDANIGTDAHEKWARSFEAYLFEGKAPSQEIATAFARFRSWLVFVYQSIKKLNAPINDRMRAVMDRMIATDEEIDAARRAPEFRPAFQTQEASGLTDAQWKAYTETAGRAVDRAKREMDARMMSEIARETTKEWREAKRAIREEVTADLEQMPVYRAMHYLRTGEGLPEGTPRMHLDKDGIVETMGEGALLRLPKAVPPLYRAKGGVHPDIMAELMGFKSGHEMLTLMMSVPSLGKAVADETALRMKQRYGDLMGDAVARARVAAEAITNDDTGELLNAEIGVLVKKGLVSTAVNKADARKMAREIIRGKTIREAMRIKLYQNADVKAANEAERAILAQDWTKALEAKKRQLLNHYLAQEAAQAEKDIQKAVDYLNKFTGRKQPSGVWRESLNQIAALLERFDFRKSVTLTDEQRRASLADWITQQEAAGEIVAVPDVVRDNAFRKPYRQMTVDDLMAVRDSVKSIEHIGRRWEAVNGDIAARKFNLKRDEIANTVSTSAPLKPEAKTRNPTRFGGLLNQAKSIEAALLKLESVFDWMDSKDSNGPLRRLIWQPIAEAETRENDLRIKVVGEFQRIMGELDHKRLNERLSIPGVRQTFLRSDVMAVALNMGNESNLDKMKRGEQWDDATLDRIVSHLNEQEWQAVQGIWDTINSLWPEIAAVQKRLTGVEPEKVEARKVPTPHGILNGGYYPLIYDASRSFDVADREAAQNDVVRFENTYLRPETRHGFTKERSQQYTRPILFDLNGAARHLTAVVHDVTHREAILDANKLLTNPVVRAAIVSHYGPEIYSQMVPWLQSIAHDTYKNDGLGAVENLFRSVRSRATIMGMGFRISTIISQLAGYSSSLELVPIKHMAGAMKEFSMSPRAMWAEVNAKSGMMRYRGVNLDRDINDQMKALTGKHGIVDEAKRFSMWGIGFMDRVVTVPTWVAAYRDHMQRNPGDEAGAISHADKVVSLTQGGGGPKDLAAIQRKNELTKLVTMFYSYFSSYYNRQRTWKRDMERKIKTGEGSFASLLARQVFMTLGPALLTELLVGKGPKDDESWEWWVAKKIAFYPLSAVPVVRDAIGVFDTGFGYSFTPAARVIDEVLVQPFQMLAKELDDNPDNDPDARKAFKQTLETTGYALGLPLGQLTSTVDNVWKAIQDDDFQLRDLVLSRPKK